MLFAYQKPLNGKSIGVVFGSFCPLHQGHLDMIMRAKKENDGGCLVVVCGHNGDKGEPRMPHELRYRYVREFFADDDLVSVYAVNDSELGIALYPNGWDKWLDEMRRIWDIAVETPDADRIWYVGEAEYDEGLSIRGEKAVLINRLENPISGTMIRNNPLKYWSKITYPFRRVFSYNILIAGTASEGKSVLVNDLGKYFNAPHSYEWARDYIEKKSLADWEFKGHDFLAFLEGQDALNESLIGSPANNGIFFADSDALVTKMYAAQYAEEDCCLMTEEELSVISVAADEYVKKARWDRIYLLCPAGKFVDDHTRFMIHAGMDARQKMFDMLCEEYRRLGLWDKVTILDGGYLKNFERVVADVKEYLKNAEN